MAQASQRTVVRSGILVVMLLSLTWQGPCPFTGHCRAAEPPALGPTREELLRKWDLNTDGRIDDMEADIARSKMRQERSRLMLRANVDPVTGLAKAEAVSGTAAPGATGANPPASADFPPVRPRRDESSLPGTRVPETRAPVPAVNADADAPDPDTATAPGPEQPANARPTGRPGDAGRERQRPGIATGGVRGGGWAARPGYGSGIQGGPLNAGRSMEPGTGGGPTGGRGGLLPRPRRAGSAAPAPRTPGFSIHDRDPF